MKVRFARIVCAGVLLGSLVPLPPAVASGPASNPILRKAAGLPAEYVAPSAWTPAAPGPLAPSGPAALATSVTDAIPLPASPVSGTLAAQGRSTLYAIDLPAGSRFEISLTGGPGIFDAYLFAPGLGLLSSATAVAHASEGSYPRTFTYDVPTDLSGTYYLEIYAWSGKGSYTVNWLVRPASERARIDVAAGKSVTVPHSTGVVIEDRLEANAVFRFYAVAGRRLQIDLAGPVGADFDLHLYAPGTTTILPAHVEPLVWSNGRNATERIIYDVPEGAGGTYVLEVYRFNGSGSATLQITSAAIPPGPATTRVAGADRYVTAAAISRASFPAGSTAAVLCSGHSFADGLAAASLAGVLDAPVLLTWPGGLTDVTGREMQRLGVTNVYIVGGPAAVGYAVEANVLAYRPGAGIQRVAGATRYETAAEVADKTHEISGIRPTRAFIASGEAFPDALALSPVAFATRTPILLVRKTLLPEETRAALTRLRGSTSRTLDLVVAGGEAAVSAPVATLADAAAGGDLVRAAGENRYETALAIAELAVTEGWASPATAAVASGVAFPDALGGAPLPGGRRGVLLLCPISELGTHSTSYFKSFDFAIEQAWVLGGASAVFPDVVTQVSDILPDTAHDYTW